MFAAQNARGLFRLCTRDDTWRYATSADPTVPAIVSNSPHIPVWLDLATAGRVASAGDPTRLFQLRLVQALASAVEGAPSGDLAVRILKQLQGELDEMGARSGAEAPVHVPLGPSDTNTAHPLVELQLLELRHALQCGSGTEDAVQHASAVWTMAVPALRHAVEAPWHALALSQVSRGSHVTEPGADRPSVLLGLAGVASSLPERTGSEFVAALPSDFQDLLPQWPSALPYQARPPDISSVTTKAYGLEIASGFGRDSSSIV